MNIHSPPVRRHRWVLVATFILAYVSAVAISAYIHQQHVSANRAATQLLAQEYAQRIQERLQSALVSTHVLAAAVRQANGHLQKFNDVAADLLVLFPGVSALQLAPGGVIRECYPLRGNEAAIGHDLLSDKQRNHEAVAAVTMRQLALAGPFPLLQGGVGTVGRLPIFIRDNQGTDRFWGFATALVRIPQLVETAGLEGLVKSGYRYELWRNHPVTDKKYVFSSGGGAMAEQPVEYVVTIFNSRWVLAVSPEAGWMTTMDYVEIFAVSLLGALLITGFQYGVLKALSTRPQA